MNISSKFPHLLHGADYNPEQWLNRPDILAMDIELMKRAQINCVSMGMFSWAMLEPSEGNYDFSWLSAIVDRLYQNGISTILATPSGAKPIWMSETYPEVRRVNSSLVREQSGERHNHCFTSPIYRKKTDAINRKLSQIFGKRPGVILWHLSNEYSGACYCPLCQDAFRAWLREKYQTIDAVNEAWWTTFWSHRYHDFSEIIPPLTIGDNSTHGLTLDWKRFSTDQAVSFMRAEIESIRSNSPDIPLTTNFMYDFSGYNYAKFAQHIDIISWDSYPQWHGPNHVRTASDFAFWHDHMRTMKNQPFLLMESTPSATNWQPVSKLKRPGMHLTSSLQAIAHGSNSVQYFQFRKGRGACEKFHGAIIDHSGKDDTRVFADVRSVGFCLQEIDAIKDSMVNADVALIYDTENRWALEASAGPRNIGLDYSGVTRDHYYAFWKQGVMVDVIDEEHELSAYKLVVAPMLYMLRNGFSDKLRAYVASGGNVVFTYHSGIVDENDLCLLGGWPGDLMDVFGIWNEEIDALYDEDRNGLLMNEAEYPIKELCAIIHTATAKTLGTYTQDFYADTPALTVNQYGDGNAYYIAARTGVDFLIDFYQTLIDQYKIKRALPNTLLPDGVTATLRENENTQFVFLQNYAAQAQPLTLGNAYALYDTGEIISDVILQPFSTLLFKSLEHEI